MPRATMPLVIGRGMDRATGMAGAQPQFPVDARNVYARDAKMAVRPGLGGTGFPPVPFGTDVLAIAPLKATLDVLYVCYDRNSGNIQIARLDTVTGVMQTLTSPANGLWGTFSGEFPVITYAEANGLMFFAHDEADISSRLPTIYYTPNLGTPSLPGTLTTLAQDLDGSGTPNPVYFRSVKAYLVYMVGVGFGNVGDPDRGDILRLSNPTDPLTWLPESLVYFGVKQDPIIGMIELVGPATLTTAAFTQPSALGVLKADSSFALVGSSFNDFAPQLIDARFGTVSSRSSINVGGTAYTWASDGPRQVLPTGTVQIGQALELVSPLPADFPLLGPSRLSFVTFDLDTKILEWCFPDTVNAAVPVPCFALSLWNPTDPRWTFFERQQPVCCSAVLTQRDTNAPPVAPLGYPSNVVAADAGLATNATYRSVSLAWTNNLATGAETVQLFAQPVGGAWGQVREVAVGLVQQTAFWSTALPLTAYNLAMRYANSAIPAVGYESDDPDQWTAPTAAQSKTTLTTSSAPVAWGAVGEFTAATTPIVLAWISAQLNVPYLLEQSTDGGVTWSTVVAGLVATSDAYPIPPAALGTTVLFRVTAQNGAVRGPTAGVISVPMFLVVAQPVITSAVFDNTEAVVTLAWNVADQALLYLVERSDDAGVTWHAIATIPGLTYAYPILPAEANTTVEFRVTGQNGTVSSLPSAPASVACTLAIGVSTLLDLTAGPSGIGPTAQWELFMDFTHASGPLIGNQVEWSATGAVVQTNTIGPTATPAFFLTGIPFGAHPGVLFSVRLRGFAAGPVYGPWSAPLTITI